MIQILVRLWIFALLLLSIVFALEGFGLITVSAVVVAVLWTILAISLLVRLIVNAPGQPSP